MPAEEPTVPAAATPAATPVVPDLTQATILTPSTAPVVLEAVVETPAATEVVAEPAVAEPAVETPAETVVAEGEKPAEGDEAAKPALHTDTETLLEKAGKPDEKPKTDEKPAGEAEKPVVVGEVATYEPFKLPEGLPIDETRIKAFTDVIGPLKLGQEDAQKLVDLHTQTLQDYAQALSAQQHAQFAETRRGWVEKIKADPVLGGAGHQTALQAAARMRDLLVPPEHRQEMAEAMRDTGIGDHIALFRLFHNAARLFDEPASPPIAARPVPDRGGSAKEPRSRIMYDHPSSRRVAGN